MRCHDVQDALSWAHDHRQEPAAEVKTHLDGCPTCRAFAAELAALTAALAADAPLEPRPGFDTRFFARLAEAKAVTRPAPWRRFGWLGAALAGGTAVAALVLTLSTPAELSADDLELAMHLELLEEMAVLSRLEEVEAFELLAQLDAAELDVAGEVKP